MKKTIKIMIMVLVISFTLTACYEQETYTSVRNKNKTETTDLTEAEERARERLETDATEETDNRRETENTNQNGEILKVDVDSLNVRIRPGAAEGLVTSLARGVEVEVIEEVDFNGQKWSHIRFADGEGYVLSEYLD